MKTVNKVILLGNLTRDPERKSNKDRITLCTFGLATNRKVTVPDGDKQEEREFHRIVAFDKLAEACLQYLRKGRKVYLEGRLHSYTYTSEDGAVKHATEIVLDELVMLDSMPEEVRETLNGTAGQHVQ